MKNKAIYLLCVACIAMTACIKTNDNTQESMTTTSEITETEKVSATSESVTIILTETTTAPTETTIVSTTRQIPVTTFDETDEILVKGQEFAEAYAEMYWNYLCGAAWENYINEPYFDFDDRSEGNFFEDDENVPIVQGITFEPTPYFKLLITDYTYDDLLAYIKSFYSDELFDEYKPSAIGSLFTSKNNFIYVNGYEPTSIYQMRNEHAHIIGYTENDDGSVTYDCFAKTTEEDDDDLYFSFTLNADGKLCRDCDVTLDMELGLFSDTYYCDET